MPWFPPAEDLVAPDGNSGIPILFPCFASEVTWKPQIPVASHRVEFSSDGHSVVVFFEGKP